MSNIYNGLPRNFHDSWNVEVNCDGIVISNAIMNDYCCIIEFDCCYDKNGDFSHTHVLISDCNNCDQFWVKDYIESIIPKKIEISHEK